VKQTPTIKMDSDIVNFVGITGASEDAARQVVEMCAGDVEQAIQLWFADEELQRNLSTAAPAAPSSSSPAAAAGRRSNRPPVSIGRVDASGVIHIDSDDDDDDDDDDVQMITDSYDDDMEFDDDAGAAAEAANVARTAQEEEDAAMAKRLQEELYSGQAVDEDGVRAPMGRTTETLVGPGGGWGMGGVDEDDMQSAVLEQLRRRRQPPSEQLWLHDRFVGLVSNLR
jgi:hypothetical protein